MEGTLTRKALLLRSPLLIKNSSVCFAIVSVSLQVGCHSRSGGEEIVSCANQNTAEKSSEAGTDNSKPQQLKLEFTSDRSEIRSGECANLTLEVSNSLPQPMHWGANWAIEHQGEGPLPAEAWPRSDLEIAPGNRIVIANVIFCHDQLIPGMYCMRVRGESTSRNAPRSNWVVLHVVP